MCGGGMYRDSLMMITGATGTGKTLIGLQFMVAGIEAGERALYLSFEESQWQLERNAAAWGMDLKTPERDGQLRFDLPLSRAPGARGPAGGDQARGRGVRADAAGARQHHRDRAQLAGEGVPRVQRRPQRLSQGPRRGDDDDHDAAEPARRRPRDRPVPLDDRGRDPGAALLRPRQRDPARRAGAEGPRLAARERDARVRDPRDRHDGARADQGRARDPGRPGPALDRVVQRRRRYRGQPGEAGPRSTPPRPAPA